MSNSSKFWFSLTVLLGIVGVICSVWKGVDWFKLVKPFFHVSLFIFYYVTARKFNALLLVFLASAMIAEFLVATNFEVYIVPIMLLFTVYFSLGIRLQYPVIKTLKIQKLRGPDILIAVGGIFLLLYIILSVFVVSVKEIEEFTLFSFATFVFSVFIATTFFITGFHRHSKKIALFIVGVCYVVVCTGSLIYELQYNSVVLLGLVNLSEIIGQLAFVYFLIHRKDMLEERKWLI